MNELHTSLETANDIYETIQQNMEKNSSKMILWYFLQGQFFLTLKNLCKKSPYRKDHDLYQTIFNNQHERMNYRSVEIAKMIHLYPSLVLLNVSIRKFIAGMSYIRELAKTDPENAHLKVFSQPVEYVTICYKELYSTDKIFLQ